MVIGYLAEISSKINGVSLHWILPYWWVAFNTVFVLHTHNLTPGKDSYVTLHMNLIWPKETVKTWSVHRQPRTIGHNKALLLFPVGNVNSYWTKHTGQKHSLVESVTAGMWCSQADQFNHQKSLGRPPGALCVTPLKKRKYSVPIHLVEPLSPVFTDRCTMCFASSHRVHYASW